MKKTLITVDNLENFICRVESRIYTGDMILTPGAKDELSKRGIAVIHGSCPEAQGCQAHGHSPADSESERLFYGIAATLKAEYGITDPEVLKDLSLKASKIIKDNI